MMLSRYVQVLVTAVVEKNKKKKSYYVNKKSLQSECICVKKEVSCSVVWGKHGKKRLLPKKGACGISILEVYVSGVMSMMTEVYGRHPEEQAWSRHLLISTCTGKSCSILHGVVGPELAD